MGEVCIRIMMVVATLESGGRTSSMALGFRSGRTAQAMKENTSKDSNTARASSHGLMAACMKVILDKPR